MPKPIVIETGIPIPPAGGSNKYPWQQLEVGQSFFVSDVARGKIHSAISYAGKRNRMKFTIRAVDGGFRVWRIA